MQIKLKKHYSDFNEIDFEKYFQEVYGTRSFINKLLVLRDHIKNIEKELEDLRSITDYIQNIYSKMDRYRIIKENNKQIFHFYWETTSEEVGGGPVENRYIEIPEYLKRKDFNDFEFKLMIFYETQDYFRRYWNARIFRRYAYSQKLPYLKRYQLLLRDIEMWKKHIVPIKEHVINCIEKKVQKLEEEIKEIKNQYKQEILKYYQLHKEEVSPYVIDNLDNMIDEWYYEWEQL
jgi:molecular chaperone GrpE (heat shock protein)